MSPTLRSQRRARERLLRHVTACWSTQALRVAIDMELPERLAAGPADAPSLAIACGAPADALQRLLRALCALGVCREGRDGRYHLGEAGEALCRCPPGGGPSLRSIVQWWAGPMWSLWEALGYSVATGRSAREQLTGHKGYGFLDAQPQAAATFHEAMQAMTALVADDVVALELWRDVRQLVDVGGGNGTLACALAAAHEQLNATVLDRADAGPAARAWIESQGLSSRCRFVAGDFFAVLPPRQDAYQLKSILHNWDDAACARILACCAQAAAPGSALVLVERVRPARLRPTLHDAALARTDLNMLAGLGGRERSREEFAALLAAAGFALASVRPTGFEFSVLHATRV